MVNAADGINLITVINGFSEVLVEVFGTNIGVGARSAVGVATLPFNIPVEVELIVEVL